MASSFRTCEWHVSRHRNTPAATAGGCQSRVLSSPLSLPRAVPRAHDQALIRQTRVNKDSGPSLRSWLLDRLLQELQVSPPRAVQASIEAFFHEAELL